jgi:hypothetical protein
VWDFTRQTSTHKNPVGKARVVTLTNDDHWILNNYLYPFSAPSDLFSFSFRELDVSLTLLGSLWTVDFCRSLSDMSLICKCYDNFCGCWYTAMLTVPRVDMLSYSTICNLFDYITVLYDERYSTKTELIHCKWLLPLVGHSVCDTYW